MRRFSLLFLFLLSPLGLFAFEIFGIDVQGLEIGSAILMVNNGVEDSAPSPVVNSLQLSVPTQINDFLYFRPEAFIFWNPYVFQDNRAVPIEADFDSTLMLSLGLNLPFGTNWTINPVFELGAETGPSLIYRLPILPLGTGGGGTLETTGWFLAGRFLYWETGGGLVWRFSELFSVALRGQFYLPIYALWDDLPLGDQIIWGLSMGLRFRFDS